MDLWPSDETRREADAERREASGNRGPTKSEPPTGGESPTRPSAPPDQPLQPSHILEQFKRIPYFSEHAIAPYLAECYASLVRGRITTQEGLKTFITDDEAIRSLEIIYQTELMRPPQAPLDPSGLATYGPYLHFSRNALRMVDAIVRDIRKSEEYRLKHPNLYWEALKARLKQTEFDADR